MFTLSSHSKKVIDAASASASIASCIRKHSGGVQNDQAATSVALIPGERGASYHRMPRRCEESPRMTERIILDCDPGPTQWRSTRKTT